MTHHSLSVPTHGYLVTELLLTALVLSGGCRDSDPLEPPPPPPPSGLAIVSNPVPLAAAVGVPSARVLPVVYVSMPSGTVAGGIGVSIRNTRTGSIVTAGMIAGGLDPVAVDATVGDTLEFIVTLIGRSPIQFVRRVPATTPPVIVRTDPPPGKRDVPLNARIIVVFSEPVDPATILTTSIKLSRFAAAVNGQVTLAADGLSATFQPDAPLLPTTDYSLEVTTVVADLDGDLLEAPVTVPFTTGPLVPEPPQPLPAGVLAFTDAFSHINLMSADGAFFTTLTSEIGLYDAEPAWSPDGTRIAFSRWSDAYTAEIYVMNADGTNQVRISPSGTYDAHPTWSPDGSRIAFEHRPGIAWAGGPDSLSVGDIYVMNADGTNRVRLTNPPNSAFPGSAFPAWSPDGEKIAFMSYSDSNTPDIYVINADGTNRVALTNDSAVDTEPAWSPDGSRVVFRSGDPAPEYRITATELFTVNADGTNRVHLTTGGGAAEPSWAPDGLSIVFTRYSGGCDGPPPPVCTADLWMARMADGLLFQLPQLGGGTGDQNWQLYPSWRP